MVYWVVRSKFFPDGRVVYLRDAGMLSPRAPGLFAQGRAEAFPFSSREIAEAACRGMLGDVGRLAKAVRVTKRVGR